VRTGGERKRGGKFRGGEGGTGAIGRGKEYGPRKKQNEHVETGFIIAKGGGKKKRIRLDVLDLGWREIGEGGGNKRRWIFFERKSEQQQGRIRKRKIYSKMRWEKKNKPAKRGKEGKSSVFRNKCAKCRLLGEGGDRGDRSPTIISNNKKKGGAQKKQEKELHDDKITKRSVLREEKNKTLKMKKREKKKEALEQKRGENSHPPTTAGTEVRRKKAGAAAGIKTEGGGGF